MLHGNAISAEAQKAIAGRPVFQYGLTSSYYPITGMMLIWAQHFSTYGIGYKTNAPKFTDVGTHPAKNDIDFVCAHGARVTSTSPTGMTEAAKPLFYLS